MSPGTYNMYAPEYDMDQHVASTARSRADACRRARTLSRQLILGLQWLGPTNDQPRLGSGASMGMDADNLQRMTAWEPKAASNALERRRN
jgi:hypothetical protein